MLLVFLLFWLVLAWGLFDGDLYAKEGIAFAGIWLVLFLVFVLADPAWFVWTVAPMVLLDIVLLLKVFGGNVVVR